MLRICCKELLCVSIRPHLTVLTMIYIFVFQFNWLYRTFTIINMGHFWSEMTQSRPVRAQIWKPYSIWHWMTSKLCRSVSANKPILSDNGTTRRAREIFKKNLLATWTLARLAQKKINEAAGTNTKFNLVSWPSIKLKN